LDGSESNWALEFIEHVLRCVIRHGAAGALHQDPRTFLASLSYYMSCYRRWVKESRDVVKQHPELFPATPAEPVAAPEPTPTRKPRRSPAARRRGRRRLRMAARSSVISIERTEPLPEVVTQAELKDLLTAQLAAWGSSKRATELSERVKAAIGRGARIERGALQFDRDYECVRLPATTTESHVW
jgi:hypothetical protein